MIAALLCGMLAGLDNLQVCSTLGLLAMSRARRHLLAMAFSFCETAAPLLGLLAGKALLTHIGPWARMIGPVMMIACGAGVACAGLRGGARQPVGESRLLLALPLSLSLDNVAAGFGISPLAGPLWRSAVLIGLMGTALSCAGLYGVAWIRGSVRRIPSAPVEIAASVYLFFVATRMLLMNA
jgi:putative Mn2+ efflux pump MntP